MVIPFEVSTYSQQLFTLLKQNGNAFSNLSGISVSEIIASPTTISSVNDDDEGGGGGGGGLSLGVIIGIAVGGAVGLCILVFLLFKFCIHRDSDDRGRFVEHTQTPLPKNFQLSTINNNNNNNEIRTKKDPMHKKVGSRDMSAQSFETVDYDYSKAYGGDTSVVSSVGGTLGDTTRQTSGGIAAGRAAAHATLGASFGSDLFASNRVVNTGDCAGGGTSREEVIIIEAPAGKLGVVFDTPDEGAPVVHTVKDSSVIADQIHVGDKLIAIDKEDVRSMTAIKVSKLISKKSTNPVRRLTIVRTTNIANP